MAFPLPTVRLISCLFLLVPLTAQAGRVKVALIDGEPVYHWTNFPSVVRDDVNRALILRDLRRQEFHLPKRFVDNSLQRRIDEGWGGDRSKLVADLKNHGETIASYRRFLGEELIVQAMLVRETKRPKNGRPPPTEADWLASLRKGTRVRLIKQNHDLGRR